jgi:hypothetical protein
LNTKHRKAVILDHLIPLHISYLIKAFGLKWVGIKRREINLHSTNPVNGKKEVVASIFITVNIDTEGYDYAELSYQNNGKHRQQRIELIAKKSNLKKGHVYYFRCPVTGNQRRKLFLYNNQFVSKQAIENPHYLSQVQSHNQRKATKDLNKLIRLQKTAKEANKKHYRKYYAGEPTKRYISVLMASDDLKTSW